MIVVDRVFRPNPGPQTMFWKCPARIIGYGGAMGGGKSRAICEKALEYAQTCPGIQILICRQQHTSIVETTRKTMFEEVLPPAMIAHKRASGGEDFVDLYTAEPGVTSRINFVGLEDPSRWFSAQIGVLIVDQVEECAEDTIVKLMTRLRHPKAPVGSYTGTLGVPAAELAPLLADGRAVYDGDLPANPAALVKAHVIDFPLAGKVILSFNPENPGHWLQKWFILGSSRTDHGFSKPELYAADADFPFGDAEFFFAKATDNPHLAPGYVAAQMAGMPAHLRRRYLDGAWEFVSGTCYFDTEALTAYQDEIQQVGRPKWVGYTEGDPGPNPKQKIKIRPTKGEGPWHVWHPPVREHRDREGRLIPAHRYVAAIDVSSGGSTDYSAIQVIDVESFEQVAEYQGKADPDLVALEAYRIGRIYNDALLAPEITGGFGATISRELERLGYKKIFTRRTLDRISKQWTDKLGWDTTSASKAHMLDTLERVLRERELKIYSERLLAELGSFVRLKTPGGRDTAGAQPGCNDDLVIALAIAVTLTLDRPRQLRRPKQKPHKPQFSVTGY